MIHGSLRAIEISGLTKVYDDGTHALNNLSFAVSDGGFHGLLGPSGSGKSMLIGIIAGLVRGPDVHVKVCDRDAVSDRRLPRTMVGLSPQEARLDLFLTARGAVVPRAVRRHEAGRRQRACR